MDGIDVAAIETDGVTVTARGPSLSISYDAPFRKRLEAALGAAKAITERNQRPGDLADLEREITHASCKGRAAVPAGRAAGMAAPRCHRLSWTDGSAPSRRSFDRPAWRRRSSCQGDRHRRGERHARQRHAAWRAGRAAGARLSRGARTLVAARIRASASGRLRQHRRHLEHYFRSARWRPDRLRHRTRQRAHRPVGHARGRRVVRRRRRDCKQRTSRSRSRRALSRQSLFPEAWRQVSRPSGLHARRRAWTVACRWRAHAGRGHRRSNSRKPAIFFRRHRSSGCCAAAAARIRTS